MVASVLRATIFASLLALMPGPVQAQDRNTISIDAKSSPWSAIGRVNRFGGDFCTGSLIGPRHVLTAAHCLYDRDLDQWVDAGDLRFVAGYHRGDFSAQALVADIVVPPEFRPDRALAGANLSHDWAVLILGSPVGVRPISWIPIQAGDLAARTGDRTALVRVGYSQAQAHVMAAHTGCAFAVMGGGLLSHDCNATPNDSGSPLLLRRNGQFAIVGISVAAQPAGSGQRGVALPIETIAGPVNDILGSQ